VAQRDDDDVLAQLSHFIVVIKITSYVREIPNVYA